MQQVIKKDGTKEAFNIEKIRKVLLAAGLDPSKTSDLCSKIDVWGKEKKIATTMEIRKKVLFELKKEDAYIYGLFKWYEHTKDKNND